MDANSTGYCMMPRYSLISLFVLGIVVPGCEEEGEFSFQNTIEAPTFTIKTPAGWTLSDAQGYDSYVGTISGPQGVIYFDQGFTSFGGLDHLTASAGTVFFKHAVIDGLPAAIIKEKKVLANNVNSQVVVTMYIDAGDGIRLNRLYTYSPSPLNENLLIAIMKTHRFK